MFQSANFLRPLIATLALATAVGCAQQVSSPRQAATKNSPELTGAWYQVYFDSNSSDIDARGKTIIESVAYVVANIEATRVTVIGKTDRVGAPPANLALAHRRAIAVRDALITAGVPNTNIDMSWTGEGKQAVATADDASEPRNRVVDVTVVKQPR